MLHDREPPITERTFRKATTLAVVFTLLVAACSDEKEPHGAEAPPEPGTSSPPTSAAHGAHRHKGHEDGEHHRDGHEHAKLPAEPALRGQSVFHLESTFQNQHGKTVQLDSLRGKITVLAMVYTHCEHACPRIIADMRRIRKAIGADPKGELQFVLVSIDPARDTVQRLQSFGEETGLTAQGWTLMRGDESDVRELAAVFGVQYRRTSETDFAHSNVISVLNREGEIVHQQQGLGVDPHETVAALRELLEGRAAGEGEP